MLALLLTTVFLVTMVPLSEATTYYVSRGEGGTPQGVDPPTRNCNQARTITTPLLTIAQGMTCLNSLGNTGGDILYIRQGNYTDNGRIDYLPNKSGSGETNRNMMAGYPGETVIIKGLALVAPSPTRTFIYLIFENLISDGIGVGQNTIHGNQTYAGHNIYRYMEIRNNGKGDGFSGIQQFDEIHHSKIHHNGLLNTTDHQTHGFYACNTDVKIHDNEWYHNAAYAIQFYSSGTGNTGCSSRSKIYNNKIYDNSAITMTANPLSHSAGGMIICCGDSVEIYNNLFYSNGRTPDGPPGGGLQFLHTAGPGTNYKVYNNTFWNNNGAGMYIDTTIPHMDIKNNIFWQNNGLALDDRSGNTTLDTTNLTVDPKFKDAAGGNFTPNTGSPAINTGVAYNGLAFDVNNQPRPGTPGTAIDKGAIEVQAGGPRVIEEPQVATFYVAPPPLGNDSTHDCNAAKQEATPKATITGTQGGISCLTAGSTLLIKAGTYAEEVDTSLRSIPGGMDWDHATVLAALGNDVVTLQLVGPGVGLFFKNAPTDHYIILDRLIVDGLGQNNTNGFVCYPGTHHIRFQNGEIKNTWFEPVYIYDGANCEVLHSTLHDWRNLSGIRALGAVSGTTIRGNTIYNGPGAGIKIDSNEKTPHVAIANALIEQNILHHVGTTSSLAAMLVGGSDNINLLVRNNLIYSSHRGIEIVTGSPTVKVYNNTVYGSTTTGIQVNSGAVNTQVKNNISYGNGGAPIVDNGSASACCVTNQVLDPTFVSPAVGNFQLQSTSTAINAGADLAPDVVFDLLGVRRADYGAYDYGAYEFTDTVSVGSQDVLGPRRSGGAGPARELFQSR